MIDLEILSEDDVRHLPESAVLDFDDEHDLRSMLVERLRAAPYDHYLRLCASYLSDIQEYLGADPGDERGLELLQRTITATHGGAIGSLLDDWASYAGSESDEDDTAYAGELDPMLYRPCIELSLELAGVGEPYAAAEAIADSALDCVDDLVAGNNLRLLMQFIIRERSTRLII